MSARRRSRLARLCLTLLAGSAAAALPSQAVALIASPATIDGPSSQISECGGAAVSADGSGGVVYVKQVGGVPHVFAAQFVGGGWRPPVRVDWQNRFGASFPRIAAGDGGRLLVVWVSQIATEGGRVQQALYSSTLGPGGSSFGEQYVVDPALGEGEGVDPSVALAANGQGLVAYRAVTDNFKTTDISTTIPRLRSGDVLADVRVARYDGELWSPSQRVNRDPQVSMRAPTRVNGPQVEVGRSDQAVVAWQEPESDGVARVWMRRVFPGSLGLAMQASPTSFDGQPVTADADAFALSVSEFGEAKVVSRVDGIPGTPLGAPRMFVSTLPVSTAPTGGTLEGPVLLGADGFPGVTGVPSVAVDDAGAFRVAFASDAHADVLLGDERDPAAPEPSIGAAGIAGEEEVSTALNPAGGGVSAWPARGPGGGLGVAVREDFPDGAAQTGLISGVVDGPVSELSLAGSESGEALVGFREGDPGAFQIVGARVSAPPPQLSVSGPPGWVRPSQATLDWSEAEDATGGVTYSLIIDGHIVRRDIHGLSITPDPHLLGSGIHSVQVLASDASGQQTLSGEAELKIDGSPPVAHVRHTRGHRGRTVVVTVRDAQSGALANATRIIFGDGTHVNGRLQVRHVYARPGRYVIVVAMRDNAGNQGVAHLRVRIR